MFAQIPFLAKKRKNPLAKSNSSLPISSILHSSNSVCDVKTVDTKQNNNNKSSVQNNLLTKVSNSSIGSSDSTESSSYSSNSYATSNGLLSKITTYTASSSELIGKSYCGLPKLKFQCQLAHGSPTGIISGFSNMKELYEKIAYTFNIETDQILFCTLNTHRIDMDKLLGGQIGLDDFIFAHCKGASKDIEIIKMDHLLGLTITDNGNGYSFIKKIKANSLIDSIKSISVGDSILKINGKCLIGSRHFEVAKTLKDIPIGSKFILRLNEPRKSSFDCIHLKEHKKHSLFYGSDRETLHLRAKDPHIVEIMQDILIESVVNKINVLLESFVGISDNELAIKIWEIGRISRNPHEFVLAIDSSDLEIFKFNDDFLFDLWGVINDAKCGRYTNK